MYELSLTKDAVMRGPYSGKYERLTKYLNDSGEPQEFLTFKALEKIIGFPLPDSARQYQAWWANQERGQSLSWLTAGYRTTAVSVDEERLTFLREDQFVTEQKEHDLYDEQKFEPLTISEAKERLARTLGIHATQIEISIKA